MSKAINPTFSDVVDIGKGGSTMTFLKNEFLWTRFHVSASHDEIFDVPAHWHETHDEYIRVVQGRLEVSIGTETRVYVPSDGEAHIPKGTVHSFRCFQREECIFDERGDPMDGEKELFFRNTLARNRPPSNFFEIMLICYYGDTRPAFPGHIQWLEKLFVTIFGGYLAPLLGYKLMYENLKKIG
ncbi:hypothetical protein B0H34DRAFT_95874 [Crassisporium funariophilum]|nr:hypothetical protein B0H34DRAFT_95874 [Crassisporium funariophilum]